MLLSKQILKNSIKGLNVCMLAGIGTLLVTGGIMHNNLYASTTIPTNYNISELTSTLYRSVPTGYTKPSYKFEVDPNCDTPSANELSASEAAEIIAQEMYRYFKIDISGKTLGLYYTPETIMGDSDVYKAKWSGTVEMDADFSVHISINPVTGEVMTLMRHYESEYHPISNPSKDDKEREKQIDAAGLKLEKAMESAIKANPQKIQDVIAASGFIPEPIKSVTFDFCNTTSHFIEPVGVMVDASFRVVTESDKSYYVNLCEDLTRVDSILMPNN